MATLNIKDTGELTPNDESGSPFTGTNIANGGNELPLKGISITYARSLSSDNAPSPGVYDSEPSSNYVSRTNPVITINGQIKQDGDLSSASNTLNQISEQSTSTVTAQDGATSTNEIDILFVLDQMCVTRGYKELYYKDTDANSSMLYGLGNTDADEPTYRHIHVKCKSFRASQNAQGTLITWTLTCEVI